MNKLQRSKIVSHKRVGRYYYRLVLRAPEVAREARPGQFVMLRVTENLDPLLARPFGISAIPSKNTIEIIYRTAGRGTMMLSLEQKGGALEMLGPLGNGFPPPEKGSLPVFVAGGSGFPPLLFFAVRAGSRARLFIGARDRECLPPVSVLKSFRSNVLKVQIATEDGSSGKKGMVSDILREHLSGADDVGNAVIYACGPRPMLSEVSRMAREHSIRCYVSMEERMACGLGACMGCSVAAKSGGYKRVCKEGPVFEAGEIEWGVGQER